MSRWASQALAVYAEPLVAGRRALVVGHAEGLAERLVELGARMVQVYGPTREAPTLPQVRVSPMPQGDFDVRDAAFDLAIVSDLSDVADPVALLARLRRVLGASGAALIASSRTGEDAYYALFEAVAVQFASVVMLAEVPFQGVAIAELGRGDEDVDVSVDTQLVEAAPPPQAYVALAAQTEVHLAPYAIVETPESFSLRTNESAAPSALAEAQLLADVSASQLEEERAQRQALERQLRHFEDALAAEKSARAAAERSASAANDLAFAEERAAVLATSLELAKESEDELHRRVTSLEISLQKKNEEALVLLAELDALRSAPSSREPSEPPPSDRDDEREAELTLLRARMQQLEMELTELSRVHEEELADAEARLRERATTLADLEHEMRQRERVARTLVTQLEEAHRGDASASEVERLANESATLRKRLDAAALEAARRESELEARAWRISELEAALARGRAEPQQPAAKVPKTPVEQELDALRQALAQEHAARRAAESGEALLAAKAEIERQSVLLAQLSGSRTSPRS